MNATLTSASPLSAEFYPSQLNSIFFAEGTFVGNVTLQAKFPTGTTWHNIVSTSGHIAVAVATPDANVKYRVSSAISSGSAVVYFGVEAA